MSDKSLLEKVMNEPQPIPRRVPDYMRKKGGIWFWTGAMIMIAFFYEAPTNIFLSRWIYTRAIIMYAP